MKWFKRISGLVISLFFLRLGVLSLLHERSVGYAFSRSFQDTYEVIGWKAYVMGVGWIGAALAVFSLFCLGEKLEKNGWDMVGVSVGGLIFGVCLCVVAVVVVINYGIAQCPLTRRSRRTCLRQAAERGRYV